MNSIIRKKTVLQIIWISVVTLFLSLNAFSVIYHNHGSEAYEDVSEGSSGQRSVIESYIVEGAGSFLDSYAALITLLQQVETTVPENTDYEALMNSLDKVTNNLEKARTAYDNLITVAESTPYNQVFLSKLALFDYASFKAAHTLNSDIFSQVKNYLQKGDITGAFKKSAATFDSLKTMLETLREQIAAQNIPDVNLLWDLNQAYAGECLFGQYTARVYQAL